MRFHRDTENLPLPPALSHQEKAPSFFFSSLLLFLPAFKNLFSFIVCWYRMNGSKSQQADTKRQRLEGRGRGGRHSKLVSSRLHGHGGACHACRLSRLPVPSVCPCPCLSKVESTSGKSSCLWWEVPELGKGRQREEGIKRHSVVGSACTGRCKKVVCKSKGDSRRAGEVVVQVGCGSSVVGVFHAEEMRAKSKNHM